MRIKSSDGFTLLEVTISLVILSIGVGTILGLQVNISRAIARAVRRAGDVALVEAVLVQGRAQFHAMEQKATAAEHKEQKAQSDMVTLSIRQDDETAVYERKPVGDQSVFGKLGMVVERVRLSDAIEFVTFSSPLALWAPRSKKKPEKGAPQEPSGQKGTGKATS